MTTKRLTELDERTNQLEQRIAELRDKLTAVQRETVSAAAIQRAVALFDPVWDLLLVPERFRILHPVLAGNSIDRNLMSLSLVLSPYRLRACPLSDNARHGPATKRCNRKRRNTRPLDTAEIRAISGSCRYPPGSVNQGHTAAPQRTTSDGRDHAAACGGAAIDSFDTERVLGKV